MKVFNIFLSLAVVFLIILNFEFYFSRNKTNLEIKKIRQQNDSLFLVISQNNYLIDSIGKNNEVLFFRNNSLKQKLTILNQKAENYKKQHEKDINYINNLSNNDIVKLFTDKFNDRQ
jgi:hypothetical protein